jgi:hypothetical protein
MNNMVLHCGGTPVDYDGLTNIELPKETNTYKPIAHHDLANNAVSIGNDLLKDYTYQSSQHAVAKDGQSYFGIYTFVNKNNTQENHDLLNYNIAIRNSYDKSMSIGVAMGATVFVCDNLALTGDIHVMRKHTRNVSNDLEEMLITNIYKSQNNFLDICKDRTVMNDAKLTDNDAYKLMGTMFGEGIIKPRQLSQTLREWRKPPYEEFEKRNVWSLYNAMTSSLKSTPPNKIMEKHIALHTNMKKYCA